MKKVGIVGGLGPASTIDYYRDIIQIYRDAKGPDYYPEIVIDSVNMTELVQGVINKDDQAVVDLMRNSIHNLEKAGADFAAIASNTPHIVWDKLIGHVHIPVISIIEATCEYIKRQNFKKVLIFAAEFTMRNGLFSNALTRNNIDWVLPNDEDISTLGQIIYPNLENGIVIEKDKIKMQQIAEKYIVRENADALLLGCTEIPLMIKAGDVSVPVINTTQIHIDAICKELLRQDD